MQSSLISSLDHKSVLEKDRVKREKLRRPVMVGFVRHKDMACCAKESEDDSESVQQKCKEFIPAMKEVKERGHCFSGV